MITEDIIQHIFCPVDDSLPKIPKHPQAKLSPSELVTIRILFSLKGGFFRAFYRWLKRDYGTWFGKARLPERTRLQRLLKTHQDWCNLLLAQPSFFTVIDNYPIELLFPIREGRRGSIAPFPAKGYSLGSQPARNGKRGSCTSTRRKLTEA